MQDNNTLITEQTLKWVRSFIIELNICPFAKRVFDMNSLRISPSQTTRITHALEELMLEIEYLDNHPDTETTLMVFGSQFKNFFDYLDLIDLAEALLKDQNYEGIYQLASFHPDYCFEGTDFDDVSNYTNRSPYPMIHILREESLDKALAFYGDTSTIPENNINKMQALGLDEIQKILLSM